MGSWPNGTSHDAWEGYMEVEREQLAQRATGKMARMIGHALPGDSEEELRIIAQDDRYLAQEGYAPLREGNRVFYKQVEELTFQDRWARIAYEKTLVRWLKERIRAEKEMEASKVSE
jgi:hypothetical protein